MRPSHLFKNVSILSRLAITVFVVAVTVGSLSALIVYNVSFDSLFAIEKQKTLAIIAEDTRELSSLFSFSQKIAQTIASQDDIVSYVTKPDSALDSHVLSFLNSYNIGNEYSAIYILNTEGKTLISTDPLLTGNNYSVREYFREAVSGGLGIQMAIGISTKKAGYYFSAPIYNKSNQIVGVVTLKRNADSIEKLISEKKEGVETKNMLTDEFGVIIATNVPGRLYSSLGQLPQDYIDELVRQKKFEGIDIVPIQYDVAAEVVRNYVEPVTLQFFDAQDNETEIIGVAKVGDYPFYFVAEAELEEVEEAATAAAINLALLSIASTLFISFAVFLVVRNVFSAITNVINSAVKISEGNFKERLEVKGGGEIASLGLAFNSMVEKLDELYSNMEEKVKEATGRLAERVKESESQNEDLQKTKLAMFNILQDLKGEREGVIKERNRFEAILASIGNGVFAIDITGKIILANKVMHTMSGKESLLGDNYHSVFKFNIEGRTNEPPLEIIEESISTGEIKILPINAVLIRLDERIIPIGGSVSPIKDAEGIIIGAVVVVRDVSLERQLEHAKSDFLSIAAHQLRTPLGSMRWNLELLLGGDYGKIPEEANSVIAQISEGNKWLLALVNDLLDVSRLDQGKIKNVVMETLIAPIIANVVSENEMAAHTKDIRILSPITVKPFHPVMVDPDLFHEVITNIVSNAVKYSLKGGVIEVDGEERDGKIKIWVKDSGIGIPEKDYGRMFDKFFRARNAVHSETVGSGLGLFVVKTYVELWNGRVWFESKEGVGTTFFIELPIKK